MYSMPLFWNPIERMLSKDDRKFGQNPKKSRENTNTKWSGSYKSEILTTRRKIGGRYKQFKSLYFLVQWKGYPDDESTWEPGTSLEHATESIEEFYAQNSKAPALTT
jgi:hypothetical protein